jgi:hypothetical protein
MKLGDPKELKRVALDDKDLEPLWDFVKAI